MLQTVQEGLSDVLSPLGPASALQPRARGSRPSPEAPLARTITALKESSS